MTKWLDRVENQELTQTLAKLMSAISEDCFCAGWLVGTEYAIPALCLRAMERGKPQPWGFGTVDPAMAAVLLTIADRLGHWVNFDGGDPYYVAFDPFPTPPEILASLDETAKTHAKLRARTARANVRARKPRPTGDR